MSMLGIKDNQSELSNKFSERLATTFLFLVGMEYIFMGFLAVVGLGLIAYLMSFLYVAPQEVLKLSLNIGRTQGSWVGDRNIELVLGLISIFGGIIGIYGVKEIRRNKKIGYKIWLLLISASIIVTLWNVVYAFSVKHGSFSILFLFYFLWPTIYSLALYRIWKSSYKDAI